MNIIIFYDDRGRWWQPGNYLTKVIDSSSEINIYNHGVTPEDIGILSTLHTIDPAIDLILVVDSGKTYHKLHHHKDMIRKTKIPTAIWLSDTHIGWEDRKIWISEFRYDHVFVSQKNAVDRVVAECDYERSRVHWLPHAVDPDIFRPNPDIKTSYDCVSVGFMNENRIRLFQIAEEAVNFRNRSTIWAWSASKAYSESRIGLNVPVANDSLNMRCFEIGACGIPQIVGYMDNDSNGLFDLFDEGDDIRSFRMSDTDMLQQILIELLSDQNERERISSNMYRKVVSQHTYRHRMNAILSAMDFDVVL
jgi:spore maturation protein CgeB